MNKFNFYVISLLFLFPSIFPLFPTFCFAFSHFFLSLFSTYLRYFVVKRIPLNLGAVVFVVVSKFIHKFMSPCSALALLEQFSVFCAALSSRANRNRCSSLIRCSPQRILDFFWQIGRFSWMEANSI